MAMASPLTLTSTLVRMETHPSSAVHDNVFFLDLDRGQYLRLGQIESDIWELLSQPCSPREICGDLLQRYQVERSECERDVLVFLEQLLEHRLVQILDP